MIVANMRLGACQARFWKGLEASQVCLGHVLGALGPPLGSSWAAYECSWASLGRIWALMGASSLDFGGSSVLLGWVLETFGGSFCNGF